jgi:hypothetical protein
MRILPLLTPGVSTNRDSIARGSTMNTSVIVASDSFEGSSSDPSAILRRSFGDRIKPLIEQLLQQYRDSEAVGCSP